MFSTIRDFLLRIFYRLLIQKTIVLNRSSVIAYEKLHTFCTMNVNTDKGVFTFYFKEDRRKARRRGDRDSRMINYVIELGIPEGLIPEDRTINNKVVVVVKVNLFKIDYDVLTKLLTDIYLDNILKEIEDK